MTNRNQDNREFDTSSLSAKGYGDRVGRDYTAHFFRWNFVLRFVDTKTNILDVGCGVEKPLIKILAETHFRQINEYVGVDLNKFDKPKKMRTTFFDEFNFVKDWKKLRRSDAGFDVVVHFEVIEHMTTAHGRKLLKGCFELLKPGGVMLMSTPCYDGKHHATSHIHEYTVSELAKCVQRAGFTVKRRFGTFMDVKHIKKVPGIIDRELSDGVRAVYAELSQYYSNAALSNFFAPLFPNHARNNLWVCTKPKDSK